MTELPWQNASVERIQRLLDQEKLPHALLLTAIEGWGERSLAQWLALRLLQQDVTRDPTELAHPDLRWIVPDGAEIKVETVRALATFAYTTPSMGAVKVAVLEEAHGLNRAAANALLKTLEEPPAGTFIILASCHPGRLLPTIRSRCQRFHVDSDIPAARTWLQASLQESGGVAADDAVLEGRLYANGGAPLAVAAELRAATPPLLTLLQDVLGSDQPLSLVDDLLSLERSQLTGGWYRFLLGFLSGREDFRQLAGASRRAVIEFADEILWVRGQLLGSNSANARLLVERLASRWHQLGVRSA